MAVAFSVQGKGSEVGTDDGDKLLANMVHSMGSVVDDVVIIYGVCVRVRERMMIIRPKKRREEWLCWCLRLCW